jgi:hypothetical protein
MANVPAVVGFGGLNEWLVPGTSPRFTRSLDNVVVTKGRVFGRGGNGKFRNISTVSATTPIIGLMPWVQHDLTTAVLRMTPTKVHKLNTGTDVWDDVTGTNLAASSTTLPQWVNHKGVLTFVTQGADRPRKYTGTGNTATLGGTPPFARTIADYYGFLMLGAVSADGITFNETQIVYSPDYDVDWTSCNGNEINLNETPGGILAMRRLGRSLPVYKSDTVMLVRFTGTSPVRFTQEEYPLHKGILAPLSLKDIAEKGQLFLATDYELYNNRGPEIVPLPPNVQRKLQETMDPAKAHLAVGETTYEDESYHLFYPTVASTWLVGRISYNFRTGEFYHATYTGQEFIRLLAFKFNKGSAEQLIASTTNLVYELDTTATTDDGTAINRYYDLDWNHGGAEIPSPFRGARLIFKRAKGLRVKISMAVDFRETFFYEQVFDLRGSPGEDTTIIDYIPPETVQCVWLNLRIRFLHDSTTKGELRAIMPIPMEPVSQADKASAAVL